MTAYTEAPKHCSSFETMPYRGPYERKTHEG
jgi:hypothetical protein